MSDLEDRIRWAEEEIAEKNEEISRLENSLALAQKEIERLRGVVRAQNAAQRECDDSRL